MADMAQDRLGHASKLYSTPKWMLRILALAVLTRIGRVPAESYDSPTRFVKESMVSGSTYESTIV